MSKPTIRYPERDAFVSTALSLEKAAQRLGIERRTLWDYYRRTNQLKLRNRDNPLCRKEIYNIFGSVMYQRQQIANILQAIQFLTYDDASEAEQRTFEYFQFVPFSKHKLETIKALFDRRFTAEKTGVRTSLEELTRGLGISQIGASRVFSICNVKPMYPKRPKIKKAKKQQLAEIVQIARIRAYSRASEAEQKTYDFLLAHPSSSRFNYHSVLKVISRYMTAKTQGETPYMSGLGVTELSEWHVRAILKFFNWEPLYSLQKLTSKQKRTLRRIFSFPVSTSDIANFMNSTYQCIHKNINRIGKRPFSKRLVSYLGPVRTNWLASQIYYALDSGL